MYHCQNNSSSYFYNSVFKDLDLLPSFAVWWKSAVKNTTQLLTFYMVPGLSNHRDPWTADKSQF